MAAGARVGPPEHPGRYELLELVHRGGEGTTYRAAERLSRGSLPVAAKRSHRGGPDQLRRWDDARAIVQSVDAPGLVRARAAFADGAGAAWFVTNWVDGEPLDDWLATRPERSVEAMCALFRPMALALDELHRRGFVHRDVTPANVVVAGSPPAAVLLDPTLVRPAAAPRSVPGVGTPGFVAPEAAAGDYPPGCDAYGFARTLLVYWLGAVPGDAGEVRAALHAVPGLSGRPDVAGALAGLAAGPARRRSTVRLARLLDDWAAAPTATGAPCRRPWPGTVDPVAALVLAVLLVAVVGGYLGVELSLGVGASPPG